MRGTRAKQLKKANTFGQKSRWVAMGALAACTVSGHGPALLLGQQAGPNRAGQASGQTLPVVQFSIDAGSLGETLDAFQRLSGWKVTVPETAMASLPSRGV